MGRMKVANQRAVAEEGRGGGPGGLEHTSLVIILAGVDPDPCTIMGAAPVHAGQGRLWPPHLQQQLQDRRAGPPPPPPPAAAAAMSPPPFPHTCSGSSEIDVIIAVITSGVMLVMPAMPVPAQQMCE